MYFETAEEALYELSQVDIPKQTVTEALTLPDHFWLRADNKEDYRQPGATWSLGPVILTRDSSTIEKSNAAVLEKDLERLTEMRVFKDEDWEIVRCDHWAVGWVEHVSFRAIDDEGLPSLVFRYLEAWFKSLREEWPIADEEHYCNLRFEEFEETVKWEYSGLVSDDAPDDWAEQLAHELIEVAEPGSREELWVEENVVIDALKMRGWLEEEEE